MIHDEGIALFYIHRHIEFRRSDKKQFESKRKSCVFALQGPVNRAPSWCHKVVQ